MKKYILLMVLSVFFLSCSKEDSESNNPNTLPNNPNTIPVSFSLTRYVPSAMNDEFQEFDNGKIVWVFDFSERRVTVNLADGVEAVFLDSGNYSYTLEDNACNYGDNRYIHPDGRLMGLMIMDDFDEGVITISDGCVDGPIFTFERN